MENFRNKGIMTSGSFLVRGIDLSKKMLDDTGPLHRKLRIMPGAVRTLWEKYFVGMPSRINR